MLGICLFLVMAFQMAFSLSLIFPSTVCSHELKHLNHGLYVISLSAADAEVCIISIVLGMMILTR